MSKQNLREEVAQLKWDKEFLEKRHQQDLEKIRGLERESSFCAEILNAHYHNFSLNVDICPKCLKNIVDYLVSENMKGEAR